MFSIPLNTNHRIINAASSPALILVASTAPNVMNIFRDTRLDLQLSGQPFRRASTAAQNFFKPKDDIVPDPLRGLALREQQFHPRHLERRSLSR